MKIIKEYNPKRCEICHQTDYFDAKRNNCLRCANIIFSKSIEKIREYYSFPTLQNFGWINIESPFISTVTKILMIGIMVCFGTLIISYYYWNKLENMGGEEFTYCCSGFRLSLEDMLRGILFYILIGFIGGSISYLTREEKNNIKLNVPLIDIIEIQNRPYWFDKIERF